MTLSDIFASHHSAKPSLLQCIALAVAIPACAISLYCLIAVAVQRHEVHECLVWQAQARDIPAIQHAPWQFEQCDTYDISI